MYDIIMNNIIIIIPLLTFLILGFFYYKKTTENMTSRNSKEDAEVIFVPSNTFIGEKGGYIYKKDDKGLGYYKDIGI